ncbi:lipopolysaccharide assembly protein LapA domain-containing protein [Kibdelosporangium philippinense]|uniref:Lipopolysaccharide assembly protein LapA domain-containing protein n=2 Tax=Kibdelosporangium philippinense TaxID=211113 RepID=A0ABS8ZT50_9PSEU|nr:lipopolysaccharide assembly protein LapA domain-containing protein [Kibdelosporangium philippinense]MCE7010777.1 lipopolysaccharide assembly protein LapA domain-containing protein [Kibdelosporangium philippinense]
MTTNPETPPTDEIPVQEPRDPAGKGAVADSTTGKHAAADPAVVDPADAAAKDSSKSVTKATRISGTWIAVIVAIIVLVFLLIFILANLTSVTVSFLGMSGELPLGVALLFAAISGAILVALIGAARILQLRRRVRRAAKH